MFFTGTFRYFIYSIPYSINPVLLTWLSPALCSLCRWFYRSFISQVTLLSGLRPLPACIVCADCQLLFGSMIASGFTQAGANGCFCRHCLLHRPVGFCTSLGGSADVLGKRHTEQESDRPFNRRKKTASDYRSKARWAFLAHNDLRETPQHSSRQLNEHRATHSSHTQKKHDSTDST